MTQLSPHGAPPQGSPVPPVGPQPKCVPVRYTLPDTRWLGFSPGAATDSEEVSS